MAGAGYDRWISEAPALFIPCVSEAVYHARYREPDKMQPGGAGDRLAGAVLVDGRRLHGDADPAGRRGRGLAAGFAGTDADGYVAMRALLGIPESFSPVGVIPVGRPLPDKRSPSLKRGWVPNPDFARWERW